MQEYLHISTLATITDVLNAIANLTIDHWSTFIGNNVGGKCGFYILSQIWHHGDKMLKPQLISTLLSIKANREIIHLPSYHFLSYLETTHSDLRGFKNPSKARVFKIMKILLVGL